MVNKGRINISEAYDTRVAYPLIIIAVLSLLFVDVNGHKVLSLKSNSAPAAHKKLVNQQSGSSVTPAANLPTLSNTVKTQDLAPGESPLDIQTASPQSSPANNESASNNSSSQLQTTPASAPETSNQPSATDTENLINGISNDVINVQKGVTNSVNSLLSP